MKRKRLTASELEHLRQSLVALAEKYGPIGVRGLFYRAVVAGLIDKTELECDRVQRLVKEARVNGTLSWELITDESRRCYRVETFTGVAQVLEAAADCFRLDPWIYQPCRLQVWVEKEGLAPICSEVTNRYRVPLFPGKGFSSLSFSRIAALEARRALEADQRVIVLQWGDYDPSGISISESLAEHYKLHGADRAEIIRVGLKAGHIELWNLPTRPTKITDSRAKGFGDERSVELDALEPTMLGGWIETEIRSYINPGLWKKAVADEKKQRTRLQHLIQREAA